MTTRAKKFFNDVRVVEAKKTLLAVLQEHQSAIVAPQPAKGELAQSYAETIKTFQEIRGGNLYFPYLASGLGRGALVELADGSVKYDFINGIGVHHFGHSHPKIIEACVSASLTDTVMSGNLQQGEDSFVFAQTLLNAARARGSRLAHCFLSSTGVMAGENAIKVAFQKKFPATRILAFAGCFMGRTLALSQMTDKAAYREGLPLNYSVDYLPFFDAKRPQESTAAALAQLQQILHRYPQQHAFMSFELILGEGGFYAGERAFYVAIMEELKKQGVAILVDEVQTFARTPELFAFQYFELDAYVDVVWIGKASQACATLFTADFKPKPGLLSQTYTASVTALAAGKVVLDELLNGGFFGANGKIAQLHKHFREKLETLSQKYPEWVSGPYGVGAMVGATVFGGVNEKATQFIHTLYKNGVMAFTAGAHPTRVRFLIPALVVTPQDIDAVVAIVEQTLTEVAGTV